MSSEPEISDYSQTLSEPEKEEVVEETDDNVQVIFSQIEPYQEELLAEDDSTAEGNKVKSSLFSQVYLTILLHNNKTKESL